MNLIAWDDYAQDQWRRGAGPGEPGAMSLPVDKVFLHHTVTRITDDPIEDATVVNNVDQGRFGKVSYSWLVHEPSRSWIECEGLHRGAHTINNAGQSLNYTAFGIGVIGNYQNNVPGVPTTKPSSTLLQLIADGIRTIVLPNVQHDWTLLGHRDVYATACCGDLLYPHLAAIRTLIDNPVREDDMRPEQAIFTPPKGHKDAGTYALGAHGFTDAVRVIDPAHLTYWKGVLKADPLELDGPMWDQLNISEPQGHKVK